MVNKNQNTERSNNSGRRTNIFALKCHVLQALNCFCYDLDENKKVNAKTRIIKGSVIALGLGVVLILVSTSNAIALSYSERYDVGHHEGALQAAYDKVYGGIYNDDCQRYDNSHAHTSAYCQGYWDGYSYNWSHLRNDITIHQSIQARQSTSQSGLINCILAICDKNSISQRSSEEQSIHNNALNDGN